MTARIGLAVVLMNLLAVPALAQVTPTVLLDDNFDGYADQAAFQAVWTPAGVQPSATLSSSQSVSSPNSVRIAPEPDPPAGANANAQRSERGFTETGVPSATNIIRFRFDFYDSVGAGDPRRHFATLQDGQAAASSGQLVAMGLNNNQLATMSGGNYYMARVLGYNPLMDGESVGGSGAFFKLNGKHTADPAAVPLRSLGWHNLAVDISNAELKFYVDGIHARTVTNAFTLRSYDYVRLGAGVTNTNTESFFDNVQVILNPPPIGTPPTEDADFDGDGDVDGQDFLTWQQNLGDAGAGTPSTGDANEDANVDGADLTIWQSQFGQAPLAALIRPVPEPTRSALALAILTGWSAVLRRYTRRPLSVSNSAPDGR